MNEKIKYGILAFLVLLIVYYLITVPSDKENFEAATKQTEVKIPALYDRESGQVVSGSEFLGVPDEVATAWGASYGTNENLDDGNDGVYGLNYAMCSKSCCSPQYPPPFEVDKDVVVDKMKGEFVPSPYACNNAWQDSGCVCMTKNQKDFLSSRGGNCGAA
jgi:hypothetical protein